MGGDRVGGAESEQLPSEFECKASSLSPVSASLIYSPPDSVDDSVSSSPSTGSRNSSAPSFSSVSTDAEWTCDYLDCGRIFKKRHDLNRHKKYHVKPYECHMPSCKAHGIAFSLKKDLARHKLKHGGHRYFCPHAGCASAVGGNSGGFSRKDNWRRHLNNQHAGNSEFGHGDKL